MSFSRPKPRAYQDGRPVNVHDAAQSVFSKCGRRCLRRFAGCGPPPMQQAKVLREPFDRYRMAARVAFPSDVKSIPNGQPASHLRPAAHFRDGSHLERSIRLLAASSMRRQRLRSHDAITYPIHSPPVQDSSVPRDTAIGLRSPISSKLILVLTGPGNDRILESIVKDGRLRRIEVAHRP
jgi:hypothetical protein